MLKAKLHDGGYCTHLERMVMRGARMCNAKFPAMFAHIEHPKHGHILYDTGYSERFFEETRAFPYRIYANLTPVILKSKDTAKDKLLRQGIDANDVKHILISHFHADHIGALKDFPKAKLWCMQSGYDSIKGLSGWRALKAGYLPGLLPDDFTDRLQSIEESKQVDLPNQHFAGVFSQGFDIFADGSLIAIELPGHTRGQVGLYVNEPKHPLFLIADSCWMSAAYRNLKMPSLFANLIMDSPQEYYQTLRKIHRVFQKNSNLAIIPSHCGEKFCTHVNHSYIEKQDLNGI